ncbi:hypothetical protein F4679DRAFT_524463 [Xylaria curta]|nr:hypothetical protein F4679DRAFT_524463 [Xylaria curta]
MPGKGPAQHRLLITHGPFGYMGPVKAHIAANNAIRRSARAAAAVVNDALAGREPVDVTSEEDNLERFLEEVTEDESLTDATSDDGVLGIDLTRRPAVYTHEPEDDSEEGPEEESGEESEEEFEEEIEDHQYASQGTQTLYHYPPLASGRVPVRVPVSAPAAANANRGRQRSVTCAYCNKEFSTVGRQRRHEQDKHIGTICRWPGCGAVTNTDEELHQHFRDHQRVAVEQGWDKTTCPWPNCGRVYSRSDTINRCFKRHNRV